MINIEQTLLLFFLIFLSGMFSSSETALTALSRFKVRMFLKKGRKGSKPLAKLKQNPHRMLSTLLICNNIVNITASVLATNIALQIFKNNALAIATGIMTLLILVFGEVMPKSLATMHSEKISLFMAAPIYFLSLLLFPFIVILDAINSRIFRIKPITPKITEEDLRNIVDMAKEEGGIDSDEKELIHNIFRFDDIDVDEVMVPRNDMICLEKNTLLKEAIEVLRESKFARFPVYEGTRDNIVGVFYYKDAINYISESKLDVPVSKLMRKPLFIPDTKPLNEALKLFQKQGQQMGVIINEHGGVSGVVTLRDILEEIVGEMRDETEQVVPEFRRIGKKRFKVLGKADLDDVNLRLKLRLRKGDYETLSGYILERLKRFPKEGESIQARGALLTVTKVEKNRILEVIVKKM